MTPQPHDADPESAPGPGKSTELGLSFTDRLVLLVGGPVAGALLGFFLPSLAGWLVSLRWVPMRGPLELIDSFEGPWAAAGLSAAGLLLALVLAYLAVLTCMKVTLTDSWIRIEQNDRKRTIARPDVDTVFVEGKKLVILDRDSRQLLRETSEARAEDIARAFVAHGYPWAKADPYEELYRRWVPDTPDLPGAVNALLKAREAALKKKAGDDIAELRDEVQKLGFVVRDDAAKQYWRPLVRP
ncbi:hypothetical protein [Streptomyces sp. B6B3]|uniref:YqeB family protein n=1 Tax=Streptomyces sp. B6B3 TaxID=3153570 RepID=UPI00325C963C